jgi:histidinol-phosphate aminotransferase
MSQQSAKIRLDLSCLRRPLPQGMVSELAAELENIQYYPSGSYEQLRRSFAAYAGARPEQVAVGNGLDEIIDLVTRTWPGRILIPVPTFSQYELAAGRAASERILVPCLEEEGYAIAYSDDQVLEASLIWVCTPNNPTGTVIPRRTIIDLLEAAVGMVAVDECYFEFCGQSVVDLIDSYPNLVVLRSFSKNFGLAGLRLGFAVSNPANIAALNERRQIFNVNRLAEAAGVIALKFLPRFREIWVEVCETRRRFCAELTRFGYRPLTSDANFVLVDFGTRARAERCWQALCNAGILTFPGWDEEFTALDGRYIRFTVGPASEMEEAIEALVVQRLTNEVRKDC